MKIWRSRSLDPYFNLAWEEWLWKTHSPGKRSLFLWQNQPCVIIGRFQNPYAECHLNNMDNDNVVLVRRKSGGGAVYQDLGNSIFTFISPIAHKELNALNSEDTKVIHNNILTKALEPVGIRGIKAQGRNDLIYNNQKISGSAFQMDMKKNLLLHHGTMLLDVNMDSMPKYLSPSKEKLASKAIKSVSSRVTNLCNHTNNDLTHDIWCNLMINSYNNEYNTLIKEEEGQIEDINQDEWLYNVPSLNETYNMLIDDSFRLGLTPEFTHRFEGKRYNWGSIDIKMIINDGGTISQCIIHTDSLLPSLMESIESGLNGIQYNINDIENTLDGFKEDDNNDINVCINDIKQLIRDDMN